MLCGSPSSSTIEGRWKFGSSADSSKPQTGTFSPETVLYFDMPEKFLNDNSIRQGVHDGRVLWQATRTEGKDTYGISGEAVVFASGKVFITGAGTFRIDALTGKLLWYSKATGTSIAADATHVVITLRETAICLDALRGNELWESDSGGYQVVLKGDMVLLKDSNEYLNVLDGKTGQLINSLNRVKVFNFEENRILSVLNSGYAEVWKAWDLVSQGVLWEKKGLGELAAFTGDRLFFVEGSYYAALTFSSVDAVTGKILWSGKLKPVGRDYTISHVMNGKIYFEDGYVYSDGNGKLIHAGNPKKPLLQEELVNKLGPSENLLEAGRTTHPMVLRMPISARNLAGIRS